MRCADSRGLYRNRLCAQQCRLAKIYSELSYFQQGTGGNCNEGKAGTADSLPSNVFWRTDGYRRWIAQGDAPVVWRESCLRPRLGHLLGSAPLQFPSLLAPHAAGFYDAACDSSVILRSWFSFLTCLYPFIG